MGMARWLCRRVAMLALYPLLAGVADAKPGIIGGLAALSGCVEALCSAKDVTEHECLRACECILTVESSRWVEEMQPLQKELRIRKCVAKVWPHRVASPESLGAPSPPTAGSAPRPKTPVLKQVVICIPIVTDSRGNFPPEVKKAFEDGTMDRHWKDVDKQLDALKADKRGRLYKTAASAKRVVVVVLNDYLKAEKVRDIYSDTACPARHTNYDQYPFDEWARTAGLKSSSAK